jgi:hypothetical protein
MTLVALSHLQKTAIREQKGFTSSIFSVTSTGDPKGFTPLTFSRLEDSRAEA